MSSTNRGGQREPSDYYKTPQSVVENFLHAWAVDGMNSFVEIETVLDPCAGGIVDREGMSYPDGIRAVRKCGLFPNLTKLHTLDIRADSCADEKCVDYRMWKSSSPTRHSLVITNPPFALAQEIIEKALQDVCVGGYVVMLLRLNFFGGAKRLAFWKKNMPVRCYIHSKRIGFTPDGRTDSIEYMHAVWRKGLTVSETLLKIIGANSEPRLEAEAEADIQSMVDETVAEGPRGSELF